MQTQVKSSGGITLVPLETRQLAMRRIAVTKPIDMELACAFSDQVMLLCDDTVRESIDILFACPGGEIQAGMLMYDVIQSCPAPMRMFCRGEASSMAALLFASGNHGRYILPHSKLMLHEPLLGNSIRGNASSIKTLSEELIGVRTMMNELLAKHTGRSIEEIEAATSYDHYFTAQESVDFRLADKIITFQDMMGGI